LSHHARAWNEPTEGSVRGNFDDAVFEHKGVVSRFSKGAGGFTVETVGPDGLSRPFAVVGTVGTAPLQQYLVETEPGRQQALDLAWDAGRGRWYNLYPDQVLPHSDGLHWSGPYKNWNARCAECHATGYEKNYSPQTRKYASTQTEKSIGCEACHGPGAAHVAWARGGKRLDKTAWEGVNGRGFTISFEGKTAAVEIQQCAGCHGRREPFYAASPLPGTPFNDAYRLALLRGGLYHPDGQIRDEVYVYGSFLQSKMYSRGVRCTDCHNAHSGALKAKGNAVCSQCHSPAGNPDFPSLKKIRYEDPKHHFHEPGSTGAQCKSCHMIERVYMGIDGRRDHSFRVPRPDLSAAIGTPNACTDCHKDRPAAWAAAEISKRFPGAGSGPAHFAIAFSAARQGKADPGIAGALLETALSAEQPGIVRATALDLLRRYATPEIAGQTAGLLQDPDPLVRAAAIPPQRAAPRDIRIKRIGPLLQDARRLVRIEAARGLLDILAAGPSPTLASAAHRALGEYQRSLAAKADFPETQLAIAGTALVFKNYRAAEAAFMEAARFDPQRADAWAMIARLRAALGNVKGAVQALGEGLAANPNDPNLAKILRDLGSPKRRK
jgi:predicted CXXCH cytochrome family protein